jgi:hypothetical protein
MESRGHPKIYLLAAVFAAASFGASANANSTYSAPVCKLPNVKVPKVTKDNGQRVLQSLWDDQATWSEFIDCVESGKTTWVDAALAIHQFSDAGASEELDQSLGEALGNNPSDILEKATIPGSTIELDIICSGPDVDDPRFDSYDLSMAEIARRLKALSRVTNQDLEPQVEACKARLVNSEKGIASFYRDNHPAPNPGIAPEMKQPRPRGGSATFPAALPAAPAGPPALSLSGRPSHATRPPPR